MAGTRYGEANQRYWWNRRYEALGGRQSWSFWIYLSAFESQLDIQILLSLTVWRMASVSKQQTDEILLELFSRTTLNEKLMQLKVHKSERLPCLARCLLNYATLNTAFGLKLERIKNACDAIKMIALELNQENVSQRSALNCGASSSHQAAGYPRVNNQNSHNQNIEMNRMKTTTTATLFSNYPSMSLLSLPLVSWVGEIQRNIKTLEKRSLNEITLNKMNELAGLFHAALNWDHFEIAKHCRASAFHRN